MHQYLNLSHPQIGIWDMEMFFLGTSISNIGGTLLLKEDIDFELWERAINRFIEVNDSIRLHLKIIDEKPVQYLSEYKYKKIELIDFTGKTKEEQDAWFASRMRTPFQLTDSDLYEFFMVKSYNGEQGNFGKFHHAVADAWTVSLLGTQIMEFYNQLKRNRQFEVTKQPSYMEYIISESEYLNSPKFLKDQEYWLEEFREKPELVSIKPKDKDYYSTSAQRMVFSIEGEKAEALRL